MSPANWLASKQCPCRFHHRGVANVSLNLSQCCPTFRGRCDIFCNDQPVNAIPNVAFAIEGGSLFRSGHSLFDGVSEPYVRRVIGGNNLEDPVSSRGAIVGAEDPESG